MSEERFDLKKWIAGDGVKDWWRATGDALRLVIIAVVAILLVVVCMNVYRFFFPKKNPNINKPTVITTPFSHIDKLDQSNVQVSIDEKPWEAGVGVGALQYDNKSGAFAGGWIRRKW